MQFGRDFVGRMQAKHRGFTLFEILLITIVLGIIAAVAMPMLSSGNPHSLQVASNAAAGAMRFARDEAMRVGKPYGVNIQPTSKRIRVFRADTATDPWTPVYDVYHPLTKNLYDVSLGAQPFAALDIAAGASSFRGACTEVNRIVFDAYGVPWCANPHTVLLFQYLLSLSHGSVTQVVTLLGFSGRVTAR